MELAMAEFQITENTGPTSASLCVPILVAALAVSQPATSQDVSPINEAVTLEVGTPSTQSIINGVLNTEVVRELERIVGLLTRPDQGLSNEDREILYANFWDLCA